MDAIAAEAGLTKPVVYKHFGDKAGLSAAVSSRVADDLVAKVTAALGSQVETASEDPRAVIAITVKAFVEFVESDPELFSFLLYPSAGRTPTEDIRSLIEAIAVPMEPILAEAANVVGDEIPAGIALRARAVLGLAYTSVDWWIRGGRDRMERGELLTTLTALVLAIFDEVNDQVG